MMLDVRTVEFCFIGFSCLSALLSGAIVITCLMRPSILISTTKPFSHILFCISFCDFIGSIANSFGFPAINTPLCACQGFLFLFFLRGSWLWTAGLVFQLRCVMIKKRLWLRIRWMHWMIWGSNIVLTFVPLSTNVFGTDDERSGSTMCNFGGSHGGDSFFWRDAVFNGVGFVCVALMCFWIAEVALLHRQGEIDLDADQLNILTSMQYYPVGMMITWLPMLGWMIVKTNYIASNTREGMSMKISLAVCEVLATQYGTVLGTVFFSQSFVAREIWTSLMCPSERLQSTVTVSTDQGALSVRNVDEGQWLPEVVDVTPTVSIALSQTHFADMFRDTFASRTTAVRKGATSRGGSTADQSVPALGIIFPQSERPSRPLSCPSLCFVWITCRHPLLKSIFESIS